VENKALIKFWKVVYYEHLKAVIHEPLEAFELAMNEVQYEPIDTRFCIAFHPDTGYALLEASGSAIVRMIEGGSLGEETPKRKA